MSFDNAMSKPLPQFEMELNIYCVEIYGTQLGIFEKL